MMIPNINAYIPKNYQIKFKIQSFAHKMTPKECFEMSNKEFYDKYCGYCGVISYSEILAMKKFAEESKNSKGEIPDLAIAFFYNPVRDDIYVAAEDEIYNKDGQWANISD